VQNNSASKRGMISSHECLG